ncbi:hypothetical protein ACHAXT_012962 [Thalassiosira profunda]
MVDPRTVDPVFGDSVASAEPPSNFNIGNPPPPGRMDQDQDAAARAYVDSAPPDRVYVEADTVNRSYASQPPPVESPERYSDNPYPDATYVDSGAYPSDEPSTGTPAIPPGTYADDDSVVSSNVSTDEEVAVLTRGDIGEEEKKGILPRNRREWCIVLLAVLLILAVALGLGLGLGYFFSRNGDDGEVQETSPPRVAGTTYVCGSDGDDATENCLTNPTCPSGSSTGCPADKPVCFTVLNERCGVVEEEESGPPFDDFGDAIEYHVIQQAISNITSFAGMAENVPRATAPERARDFLVLRDTLPLEVLDQNQEGANATDDLLLNEENGEVGRTRPYISKTTPAYRVAQRFAVAVLFYAANGRDWDNARSWMEPGVHECDFVGVTCEELEIPAISLEDALMNPDELPRHDDGRVDTVTERMIVAIDLPDNNLGGYLPQEIVALPFLRRLGLWGNEIGGELPPQLGMLRRLGQLLLDGNAFEGEIPPELGQLTSLTDLYLADNRDIGGRIPPELGDLSSLERLKLSHMDLRGGIPPELGNLRNLVELYLNNNRLGRNLPESLQNLVNLEDLVLSGNEFTGGIPPSWRALQRLKRLEVQDNDLDFDDVVDERFCSLREEGTLEALVADCGGEDRRALCSCCTECVP